MKRRILRGLLLSGLLLSGLLALGACGDGIYQTVKLACETDAECVDAHGAGFVCFEDGCGSEVEVAVVVAPNSTGLVTQDFNPVDVSGSRMDLRLNEPARIEGVLQIDDDGERTPYSAGFTISAVGRSSNVPGVEFAPIRQVFQGGDGRFSLAVSPGVWDLTATAENKEIPPAFTQKSAASGLTLDPELLLAGRGSSTEFRGEVVRTAENRDLGDANAAFRFQLFDPLRNVALSQSLEFAGSPLTYALTALRSAGEIVLRVTPVGGALLPAKDFQSEDGRPDSLGLLELGDFGSPVEVSGKVLDQRGNPIVNALLHFEGKVRGGGTFTADTKTLDKEQAGEFSLQLLPNDPELGRYRVTVQPPPESPFASTTIEIDVPARAEEAEPAPVLLGSIACPPKSEIAGIVTDSSGAPLDGVVVQIEPNTSATEPGTSRVETITAADGNYTALVEPGAYRVVVKPGFQRKLPWASRRVMVSGPTTVPTIALSEARIVDGAVTGPQSIGGRPIPYANVSVYRVPPARDRRSGATAIKLYDAITDAQGRFQVILPKSAAAVDAEQ